MNNSTANQFWKECVVAAIRAGRDGCHATEIADMAEKEYLYRCKLQAEEEARKDHEANMAILNSIGRNKV